jgi:hypothetical protein
MKSEKTSDQSISDLYHDDLWVMSFMHEIYDLFGIPCTTQACMNPTDRLLYAWGMMSLVHAMQHHDDWKALQNSLAPKDAALTFIKKYFVKTSKLIITCMPEEKEHPPKTG